MNDNPPTSGLTRRSFIKRSVVAAVAVSSMTIFSGLVRADLEEYGVSVPPGCSLTLEADQWDFGNGTVVDVYKCSSSGPICNGDIACGRIYEMDPFTGEPERDPVTGQMIWTNVILDCAKDRQPTNYCLRG